MNCAIPVELIGNFGEAYPGHIVDYKAPDSFVFRFVGEFPGIPFEVTVAPTRLRKPPKCGVYGTKEPDVSVGDHVEVLAGKSASNESNEALPPSWWPARITKRRGDFAIVEFSTTEEVSEVFTNFPKPHLENVVEINQIRPKNSEKLLSESDFLYHIFDVPQELVGLFKEPSNIEHIIRACGQSMLFCQIKEDMQLPPEFSNANISEGSMTKFLVVCTSLETKLKAETINHDVIRMLRQKHSILHQISELSRRIKEVNSVKSDEFICAEFSVEEDLVGHSIGAGGANIRRARSVDGIVSVILNPDTCTFRVTGKTKEAVENAKKLLEYATEAMQVPQQYVGRIVGQKNRQIQALVDRVGLARIRVQAANEVTVPNCVPFAFTGTRSAINDAKILINFITDNLREIDQLQAKITPHEYNRFNNGNNNRYKRRDPSSKSESARGERTSRFHQMDSGQATDNGLTTATTFNGDVGGRFRSGRVTDTGTEHSDSTSFRNSRPSNNRRRKNHHPSRGGGGGGKPSSPPRQKSLPPPAPRTEEPIEQPEVIPRPGSRHHDGGGRRGKGGNRNQTPQAGIEGVSITAES